MKATSEMLSPAQFLDVVDSPSLWSDLTERGAPSVLVDLDQDAPRFEPDRLRSRILACPLVLVGVRREEVGPPADSTDLADHLDLIVVDPGTVLDAIGRTPIAATTLMLTLRASDASDVPAGLAIESASYSTLQAGPEFADWLATRKVNRSAPGEEPPVLVERIGNELHVVLNRPRQHNALNVAMRDGLHEALLLALWDDEEPLVVLSGNGPSFCSGGDLSEFGTLPDPATAHLTRLARSCGSLVHQLSTRIRAELHGACFGAGIEIPAFSGVVTASPDVAIRLPELAFGLIPGAGGTVSVARRIGRQRTAEMVLSGRTLDATTALDWGLVDQIRAQVDPTPPDRAPPSAS